MDDDIEFRLRGSGMKPGLVRSHELAEILEAVESFVTAEALASVPSLNKDQIIVGLYEISDKSVGLRFKSTMAAVAIPAFISATTFISESDFESLSPQSLKPLKTLAAFTRRHNCLAELQLTGSELPLAAITPETEVPEPARLGGPTEIVAKVLRVGGKVPRAMIELLDGTVIYCDVAMEIARDLGHRLYSLVALNGFASWDARTIELQEFTISSFKEFPQEDPLWTLSELQKVTGSAFSDVVDVPSFVSKLRREGGLQ